MVQFVLCVSVLRSLHVAGCSYMDLAPQAHSKTLIAFCLSLGTFLRHAGLLRWLCGLGWYCPLFGFLAGCFTGYSLSSTCFFHVLLVSPAQLRWLCICLLVPMLRSRNFPYCLCVQRTLFRIALLEHLHKHAT